MKRSEIILMVLQVPLDFLMLILAAISAYFLRFSDWAIQLRPVIFKLTLLDFLSVAFLVGLAWLIPISFAGLYSTDPNRKLAKDLSRVILACSTGLAVVAVYVLFSQQLFDSRFLVATSWVLAIVYVSLGRILMRGFKGILYRLGWGLRRVAVIGEETIAKNIVQFLRQNKKLGYYVVAEFISFNKGVEEEITKLNVDEMFFINPRAREEETLAAIDYCNEYHKTFKYSADLFATYSANMTVSALAGMPIVELKRTPLDGWGRVAKRLFDIFISILVIIITLPIMFLVSLIILLETGRPIIYKNERVGIRGKKFLTLKFRSMYQKDSTGTQFGVQGLKNEEKEKELIKTNSIKSGPVYKIANDPRVTRFGRFIRRWSLDELPQFFNVLVGEMSVVGPRPHQSREVEQYKKHERQVLTLKPGITGIAQISGRSDLSFADEVRLDVLYIERWSLFQDLIIFLKTPFVVLKRKGAL